MDDVGTINTVGTYRVIGGYKNLLIGLIVLLNIILRYVPSVPTPLWQDTYLIYGLANHISEVGYIQWATNPLSLFGLHPLSYPTATPLIYSVISQVSGNDIGISIFAFGVVLSVLGVFASYSMALKFKNDRVFSILVAFIFTTTPLFVELTRWNASARNLFLAILPLIFYVVFNNINHNKFIYRNILIASALILTLLLTHRLYYMLFFIIISYMILVVVGRYWERSTKNIIIADILKYKYYILIVLYLVLFSIQLCPFIVSPTIWQDYTSGAFASGTTISIKILNMATNFVGQMGISAPLSIIGLLILFKIHSNNSKEIFLLLVLATCTPFLANGIYTIIFILPLVCILAATGLEGSMTILKHNLITHNNTTKIARRRYFIIVTLSIIVCLMTSLVFTEYIIYRHIDTYPPDKYSMSNAWMTDDQVYAGLFISNINTKTFLPSDDLTSRRLYATSGIPGFTESVVTPLIENWVELSSLELSLSNIKNVHKNSIYELNETPQYITDRVNILYPDSNYKDELKGIIERYNISVYVIDNGIINSFKNKKLDYRKLKQITPCVKFHSKIYMNSRLSVFQLNHLFILTMKIT